MRLLIFNITESPKQNELLPVAESKADLFSSHVTTIGLLIFTVLPQVDSHVNVPPVFVLKLIEVAPTILIPFFFHWYAAPCKVDDKVTLLPAQIVVEPSAVIVEANPEHVWFNKIEIVPLELQVAKSLSPSLSKS